MSNIIDPNTDQPFDIKASSFEQTGAGFGGELAQWNATSVSADAALLPSFNAGNARAQDLVNNDGYAKAGVQLHIDHIVGSKFKLSYKPNYRVLGVDKKTLYEFVKQVEAEFSDWADDESCFIDAERKRTFTMIIREAIGTHCKTGEVTAKAEFFKKNGTGFNTSIKMIDYARICNPNLKLDSSTLRGGIKMDKHGATLGAWVRKTHPNDFLMGKIETGTDTFTYVPKELPWGRQQFLHFFEPAGDGQTRGVNNFLTALSRLKMLEKFQSTTLQNAIVNAMYAAVIESDMDSDEVFKAIGDGGENSMLNKFMDAKANWHNDTNITLNGVKLPHLLPTEKLNLTGVSAPDKSLGDFESGILRYISKSLGVSYEQLSGDFSKTNYSSARASILESYRYFMGKREVIAKRFASAIFTLWFEEAINLKVIKLPKGMPTFYKRKSAWTRCDWIGAGKTQIDGLKEVKESVERISNGLSTYEKELANIGEDYAEIFDQQLRETEMLAEQGRKPIWMTGGVNGGDEENADDEEEEPKPVKTNPNPEVNTNG